MGTSAFLGLGSNLGDRLENLRRAVEALAAHPGVRVVRSSRVYETDPIGGPPQPEYLNAVIEVETELTPHDVLRACQAIEEELGRERVERWGPRTIDLDILTFGEEEIDDSDLTVPHPRLLERRFVLAPLLELDPDLRLPGEERLADIPLPPASVAGVRPFAPPLEVPA